MNNKSTNTNSLLRQSDAVGNYLDELLTEATNPSISLEQQAPVLNKGVYLNPDILIPLPVEQQELESKPEAVIETVTDDVEEIEPVENSNIETSRLDDFEFPLQCLMFKVKDHLLAVPLIKMGGVVPWSDKLTQIPQASEWFLGLLKHREVNVQVVDTAKLLQIPESKTQSSPQHFLVFEQEKWAISCDELGEVKTLQQEDVKWHQGNHSKFALGTIKESLATLLNPNGITKALNSNKKA